MAGVGVQWKLAGLLVAGVLFAVRSTTTAAHSNLRQPAMLECSYSPIRRAACDSCLDLVLPFCLLIFYVHE